MSRLSIMYYSIELCNVLETGHVLETSTSSLIFHIATMFTVFFQFTAVSGTIFDFLIFVIDF
jgi:hypothetical protein